MVQSSKKKRTPDLRLGAQRARQVFGEIGLTHPTEIEIDLLAYMRGALIRPKPVTGSQANVVKVGKRAVIGVRESLLPGQRRFAIAHELGHIEVHPHVNHLGLCTGEELLANYEASGREEEANAFASELLMPETLYEPKCDILQVRWEAIKALADEFQVSLTAAAIRFVELTYERVALVCAKDGAVKWSRKSRSMVRSVQRGMKIDQWSLAYDYFAKGELSKIPETVRADAWFRTNRNAEIIEHSIALPNYGIVLSLLWVREGTWL